MGGWVQVARQGPPRKECRPQGLSGASYSLSTILPTGLMPQQETRVLMDAYVGAVYVGGGFTAVLNWISALVDPSAQPKVQQGQYSGPETKRSRTDSPMAMPLGSGAGVGGSSYGHYNPFPHAMPPQPPTFAPPPPPRSHEPFNHSGVSRYSRDTLAHFSGSGFC